MRNPRFIFWSIIVLTVLAVFINLPSFGKLNIKPITIPLVNKTIQTIDLNPSALFSSLGVTKPLEFRQGLDLKGGTSMTLKADMSKISSSQRQAALDSAKTIIEKRVNLFGVSEPLVQTSVGNNNDYRIIVELPNIDINQARSIVGTTAQLSFWEETASPSGKFNPSDYMIVPSGASSSAYFKKTNLSGKDLSSTAVTFDTNTGKPEVQLTFTTDGGQKFADITKRDVGKILAIVLDNQIIEMPRVSTPILNGSGVISGSFTVDSANALSTELNAGALPVPLSVLSEQTINPTLGVQSLEKSLFAGILGFVIIVVFMTVLYGRLGIIASVALLLYTLFNLAIFKLSSLTPYGITLTLSGIAGFILSIGMAVDANILIFERMKEEKRLGKSLQSAIEAGFSRAWTSIRDSNVSTIITCFVLYEFGTGSVRGFALVLAIGVIVSMFSAIVVTRTFLRIAFERGIK